MAFRLSILALASTLLLPLAAQERRIIHPIDSSRFVQLKGSYPRQADVRNDRGPLDPATPMPDMVLVLKPSGQQSVELEKLLEEQRDPLSPNYQRWLTPEEYGQRFGLAATDLDEITAWLRTGGFTVEQMARGRNWIRFTGTAGQVSRVFRTQIHRFSIPMADSAGAAELHYANLRPPSVPASLADVVSDLRGLDDFRPLPMRTPRVQPAFNGSSGAHYVAPDDMATIYNVAPLYKAGFDGTGQKIVIAGQTRINISDIRSFRMQFMLPESDPQIVLVGSDPGIRSGDLMEANLDIEWAAAVARKATIVYVYSQNVFTSVQYAIDQNLAPVISLSYGACETGLPASYRTMAQQANAQGITWLSASGDSGAAGCDAQGASAASNGPTVIFPANIPEVTAVGGTEFNEGGGSYWTAQNTLSGGSALSYIPEKGWNDSSTAYGIVATGGGASSVFPKPSWQTGPGVPNDGARDVPDVSLTASGAHDGYIIYSSGILTVVGGTSASTPSLAGMVALLNQYLVNKGVQATAGVGNINPALYRMAQSGSPAIHDVTVGDNIVPCRTGTIGCTTGTFGFKAGSGYDQVTGVGSVDANNLVSGWTAQPSLPGTTTTVTASPSTIASTGTTQVTASVKAASGTNTPAGSVTFSVGSVTLGTATLSGSESTATASMAVKGSSLSTGSNTVVVRYLPSGNFSGSTGSVAVTVTAPLVSTTSSAIANPTSVASGGTTQVTVTVKSSSGTAKPAGSVALALGGSILGSVILSNGTGSLPVKASNLTVGSNTIAVNYTATGNFANSSGIVAVILLPPPVATTTSATANSASIASTASTQLTVAVKAASGTDQPTGSVTISLGDVRIGSAVSLTNGSASITVKGSSLNAGVNTIVASYVATGNFQNSSAAVPLTVTIPPVTTTTRLAGSPTTILTTASTQVTATVTPATGTAPATGNVSFLSGSTNLGSAPLANGKATITVAGSSFKLGANTITANYVPSGNFAASTGTASVTVNAATTTSVAATAASIVSTGSTQLTATVKTATGDLAPAGTVKFMLGTTTLGSVALSNGVATLLVKGSSLKVGSNVLAVNYLGSTGFVASSNTISITVTPPVSTAGHR